jgi:hypothetical protein
MEIYGFEDFSIILWGKKNSKLPYLLHLGNS